MRVACIVILFVVNLLLYACSGSSGNWEKRSIQVETQKSQEPQKLVNSNSSNIVKIVDGDTYDILLDGIQTRIRMDGIDAPERGMAFYKKSKEYLGQLCIGKHIRLEGEKKDRYGRLIAKSYLPDGRELGEPVVGLQVELCTSHLL